MINQNLKKNIRLLSERYEYKVSYQGKVILINNEKSFIEIFPQSKDDILVKYNFENGINEIKIQDFEIYDLLIKIFQREELEKVNLNPGYPLNLDDLKEEFGDLNKFQEELLSLMKSNVDYLDVGGNRVLTEFYKNVLILRDDIGYAKSNIINLSNDKI